MFAIPGILRETLGAKPEGAAWLARLPDEVARVSKHWSLRVGKPMETELSCAWVAPCTTAAGHPAVLKLGYPHMEARDEIEGLEFWAGSPTVQLLRADKSANAMLLERCSPGTLLRELDEHEQDEIIARLMRGLWREPPKGHGFRPLADMIEYWCAEAREAMDLWSDRPLVEEGLSAFAELAARDSPRVLLATDLHAGNVLRAQRSSWLVIDPKPFVGDPCYDATQHLMNCRDRMSENPLETIRRLAALLDVDESRLRHWAFARFAVDYRSDSASTSRIATQLAG